MTNRIKKVVHLIAQNKKFQTIIGLASVYQKIALYINVIFKKKN